MKGTIDATLPDAERKILQDEKEMAEHATIVDLLRNDLSMVATDVRVSRYRYVERINTMQQDLLQVSSEIIGRLPDKYRERLGDILFSLLPAGSICGAPKIKTLEIIRQAEGYDRGFYTGVCGYFDGENLDSAVMIRFMEQTDEGLVYKSGGGITFQSELDKEYEELIQKVYVPVS
jgi:para-aminobenzoate synthetase component 1